MNIRETMDKCSLGKIWWEVSGFCLGLMQLHFIRNHRDETITKETLKLV